MVEVWRSLPPVLQLVAFFVAWLVSWSPIAWMVGRRIGWRFPQVPTPAQKLPLVLSLYLLAPGLLWLYGKLQAPLAQEPTQGLVQGNLQEQAFQGLGFGTLGPQGLGWHWTLPFAGHGLLGVGLGWASLGLLWSGARSLGWLTLKLDRARLATVALPILLVALLVSAVEETLFREIVPVALLVVLTTLIPGRGDGTALVAIALANLIFALLHLPWEPLKTGVPQLPGLWLMGVVLALSVCWSGDLALAIGLHGGWVWAIASLDAIAAVQPTGAVPAWVTGLNGHLTAGAMGIGFLSVLGTALGLLLGG